MKRVGALLLALALLLTGSGCGGSDSEKTAAGSPAEVAQAFFRAFQTADYETMKTYCTDACVENYFHDGDVFGMIRAKLTALEETEQSENQICNLFVTVEMETAETAALYPDTETSFYIRLTESADGLWQIDEFFTGL